MSRFFQALSRAEQRGAEAPAPPLEDRSPVATLLPGILTAPASEKKVLRETETILHQPRAEHRLVIGDPQYRIPAESFRLLRLRLETLREKSPFSSLLVTSSIPREGKSVIALDLAAALVLTSAKVLLVDADLRKPSLGMMLGVRSLPGLNALLEGRIGLDEALCKVQPMGLSFLPAGKPSTNPAELVQSPFMRKLLTDAALMFDWIVVDSTPVLPFAESVCLASVCGATLLVAREGFTPEGDYRKTLDVLKGTNVVGAVLNGVQQTMPSQYYRYAYPPPSQTRAVTSSPQVAAKAGH